MSPQKSREAAWVLACGAGCEFEINNVVSLQVVAQAEIDDFRRIKLDRKRFEFDCYTRIKDDAFSGHVVRRELP